MNFESLKLPKQERFFCENCKREVFLKDKYCDKCGLEIEWPEKIEKIVTPLPSPRLDLRLVNKSLFVLGVLLVSVTLVNFSFQTQGLASPRSIMYDDHFVEAMNNLSRLVPDGAVIVVSTNAPFVAYFTEHDVKVPFGSTSMYDLVNFMRLRGFTFLVVFEGKSDVPALKPLFSSKGLQTLETAFTQLAIYRTDFYIIHVYQIK